MTAKIEKALDRLNFVLPLKQRQDESGERIKALHRKVLRSFVERGRILTRAEMAQQVDHPEEALDVLKRQDMVVFSADGEPLGAYPFTMEEREHKVQVNGQRVNAMCALDALAVSPMFAVDTRIESRCRVTGDPIRIRQSGERVDNPEAAGDVHFGILWGAADDNSCCADSLCMEMIFLRDTGTAQQWLADDPDNREVFTLDEAIEFAQRFFVPLMSG